ncbi:MAG: RluA family pseudouridine synthase [Myxococcales bacterium]|nr:RluA family pseudouridine synthase [Myxococcales bacterium]
MSGPDVDPGEEVDADELDEELVDELVGGGGGGDEREHRFVAEAADAGGRLDAVVAARVAALSRAQVQRLIEDGQVTVGGVVAKKAGARLKAGEDITIRIPAPSTLEVVAQDIPLVILHEDADLIVIDKPAGLVVHPAPGHASGTLVNALLFHCKDLSGIGGVLRPGIVHRLDRDTTGVMVATKSDRAHAGLTAAFAAKSRGETGGIDRSYLAIAAPPPPAASGTLRTMYGRHPIHRKKFSSKVASGKAAVTHYEIAERLHGAALVRLRLETGRTHQIRVHAADHGWPLLGDQVYGVRQRDERLAAAAAALGRQALHAAVLAFEHPVTGVRLSFESPLPPDLEAARRALA